MKFIVFFVLLTIFAVYKAESYSLFSHTADSFRHSVIRAKRFYGGYGWNGGWNGFGGMYRPWGMGGMGYGMGMPWGMWG
ncbi:hypothetical protein QR680_001260 [Steinernema hermaphroditum]|uniref:Uncharacterized protein n=1 Tax=Steinernema hermaphroditum TaxID=289476 RepID=A0AA39GZ46_9BILA|nr:hypothetical protein QR680_001260 [Steinernema hermaphroditum]